jgi:hypothetical protein
LGLDLRKAVKNIIHGDQSSYVSGQKKVSSEFEVYKFLVFRTTQIATFNYTESVSDAQKNQPRNYELRVSEN